LCGRCRRRRAASRPWRRRGRWGGPRPRRVVRPTPRSRSRNLVPAFGAAVLERHAHDLVTGRHRAVPRSLQRHRQAPLVFRRELVALVKDQIEQRGVGGKQQIRGDRRFELVGGEVGKAGHRVLAGIGIGPTVKPLCCTRIRKSDGRLSPRPSRSCTTAHRSPLSGLKASAVGFHVPETTVAWLEPLASKRWIVAFRSGSTPTFVGDILNFSGACGDVEQATAAYDRVAVL
jgi:hypothetical protein